MLKLLAAKFCRSNGRSLVVKASMLVLFFGVWGVQSAYAGLSIRPTTWNVIGLDSNNVNSGPNSFQVGARVCNTGATAVTNVSGTFVWDTTNLFITLAGPNVRNVPSLAAGSCVDFYYSAIVTRTSLAYNATRGYHITVTGDSVASVSTPVPRELYVEKLISQNRNSVNSITGPTTVYVGQTYTYTVNASTATGGYAQLEAFLDLSNIIFQVQSISTTYTAPSGGTNDKFYADACGWDNNPLSVNYRSCIGPVNYSGGKAGGTVVTTYTVRVLSTGNTTAGTLIMDFSGSSYHYNSDYGVQVISSTALPPPLTLSKIANPTTAAAGATVTYTLRVANTGPVNYTLTDFVDTPPSTPASPTYISGSSYFNGVAIPNPVTSGSTRIWTGSFLIPAGQTRDLTYQLVMPNTPGTYVNTAVAHADEFQIDTTQPTTDNAPATASVTVPPPDMTIAKSHTGNFTQGQVGATYSIIATNSGSAPTSAAVSVTDTLPAGLTATAISGTGWSCVLGTLTCTRNDALSAGASYPAITVTVNVANNAAASVTNTANVSGGGETNTANNAASDPTTINQLPDLTIAKSHIGNFSQGQVGATYSITATNSGFAPTSGTVTVTDTLPAGLTATAISGTGWICVLGTLTCTRNDVLAVGASYPAITLTVAVAVNAPASVTNSVTVSGGGQNNTTNDTATDPTTITQLIDLTITKSHSGNFTQGQVGATYSITATNPGTLPTIGIVTVTDTLPAGLTATAISGPGWICVLGTLTCTRISVLPGGASYPAITLTVNVANNAAPSVTNTANVSGGGQSNTTNDTASDPTTINQLPDLTITKSHVGNFTQGQVGATYSITATNVGLANSSGAVAVTDTLPAGLTATAISGSGWACVFGTLTCTRNDVLAAGASYPVITLTVNVANNAAASVTNSTTVSGGGQIIITNDMATDPTTVTPFTAGLVITPDAGTRPSVVAGQTTAVFNFRVTNTGNSTDQVRFLALGASAQVTGPAIITDIVIDTDDSQTVNAPDTDIKNNPTDVLSAALAPNGFINVLVRILVNSAAAQGEAITVTLGDAATGSPTFDDQAADSSAHEVRSVATPSTNGLREARGDRTALVDNDAQIYLEMTAPSGPVPLGSDITYTLQVSNPGLRDLTGQILTNAPVGSNSGIFIIAPIPLFGTVLKSGQTFPAGTLYTTSVLSIDPLTAAWTTTPPADLTTLKRIAFNMGATLAPGVISTPINMIVTITTNDATNPIQEIADAFGRNSLGAGLTDQSGDISRIAGDGNANFNEGPERGTIDGDGIIQLTTLQAVGSVLVGPVGQPGAVGPTNNNDDYSNRSVTAGITGVAPGGTTTASSTITFTNTVQNTGSANDTFTLTAPTVYSGFIVRISTDGGTIYTTVSGGGSATVAVNFGSQSNILVQITAPSGQTVLTGYPTTIRATSGITNSIFNETIDRLYTGYLHLSKSQVVINGTGFGGATDAVAGAEIQYTISYTNISSAGGTNSSTLIATTFITTDPIPANTDFKVGSVTTNLGSTGLTVVVTYSNDGGATWTYTPASGAGGAPAGYDRNVTNIRWSFTGNLSQTAPNNTGSVGFTVRIR
jgi:uncharacterized repeat protein (TIGR01451 family)